MSGWQDHHTTDFAVSLETNIYEERLVSAHANCNYRKYFGRENQAGQKRAKTKNVRVFTAPFRTDKYRQHHEREHSKMWKDYQASENKAQFYPSHQAEPEHTHIAIALLRTGKCTVY